MKPKPIDSIPEDYARRVRERLRRRSELTDQGCLLWTGPLDRYGYGRFHISVTGKPKKYTGAHRAAWLSRRGDIPAGMVIDHLCRNRSCINVAHLELVTGPENTRRSDLVGHAAGAMQRAKVTCVNGHPFTPENTRVARGLDGYVRRLCIACNRERGRARRIRLAAA